MKARTPPSSESEKESRFSEAIRCRDEGRSGEALKLLSRLQADYPDDLGITLVLAGVLLTAGCFEESRQLFDRIIREEPRSDLASRGLFHSLWKLERHEEAFAEMRRFLSISDSEAYRELLSDMNRSLAEEV